MSFDILQTLDVIEAMENFVERIRPPEEIRKNLDIGYKIEDQSIYVFEIRPRFDKPEIKSENPIAKASYVKSKKHWKVFWLRADLKWHPYPHNPTVMTPNEFCNLVEEDKHNCFFG